MYASSFSSLLLIFYVLLVYSAFPTAIADLSYSPLRTLEDVLDEGPLETPFPLSDPHDLGLIPIALSAATAILLVVLCGLSPLLPRYKTHFVPVEVRMTRGRQSLKAMGKAFVTTSFVAGKHIATLESRLSDATDLMSSLRRARASNQVALAGAKASEHFYKTRFEEQSAEVVRLQCKLDDLRELLRVKIFHGERQKVDVEDYFEATGEC